MKFLDSDTLVHSASGGLVFIDVRSEAEVRAALFASLRGRRRKQLPPSPKGTVSL